MNYITSEDIVKRLITNRNSSWSDIEPNVYVAGKPKTFGVLVFTFGEDYAAFNVYIKDEQTINAIYEESEQAIKEFTIKAKELDKLWALWYHKKN